MEDVHELATGNDMEAMAAVVARNPHAVNQLNNSGLPPLYTAALFGNRQVIEFNAVGYAIHCWQLGTLRILLQSDSKLSDEDQRHILRISDNDQQLLDELMAIQVQ